MVFKNKEAANTSKILSGGSRQNRTADTQIFSLLLYRLSYRARLSSVAKKETRL